MGGGGSSIADGEGILMCSMPRIGERTWKPNENHHRIQLGMIVTRSIRGRRISGGDLDRGANLFGSWARTSKIDRYI